MIVVDSSVWIDYFRLIDTPQAATLDRLFGVEPIVTPDLILVEVLQGFTDDAAMASARDHLSSTTYLTVCDEEVAFEALRNYRFLRSRGITVRRTIDTLIATRCIVDGLPLLYSDRDFDPFVAHLNLRSALKHLGAN
ncbi:MAG: PIN domain nuclease [Proteobacteria bacterium]|nr:PIN domain nuclease [Pseudomonadota bacterium]